MLQLKFKANVIKIHVGINMVNTMRTRINDKNNINNNKDNDKLISLVNAIPIFLMCVVEHHCINVTQT